MTGDRRSGPPGQIADALSLKLAGFFAARGYQAVEPAMLIPADIVLDHMGEDIRRRLLLATAPDGSELCLRPDFTLPVALLHIENGAAPTARYAYAGLAFRFPAPGDPLRRSAEFRQVGIEDYGDGDQAASDAAVLDTAAGALAEAGLRATRITLGDVAIFAALIDRLGLTDTWSGRLKRLFWRRIAVGDIAAAMRSEIAGSGPASRQAELGRALAGMDRAAARAMISEVMAIAGTGAIAGRNPEEIAARFVERSRGQHGEGLRADAADLVEAYLAIDTPAGEAVAAIARLAGEAGIDLAEPIVALERRLGLIVERGIDLSATRFQTAFGRRIEYYTGHVFEIRAGSDPDLGPIASGGRYNRFLADLGAPEPVPAVGCSVYVDRLAAAAGAGP